MSRYINVGGAWRSGGHAWVNINGAWHAIGNMWININNAWRALFTYSWSVGAWGGCSASCGGGTQTRSVTCTRNDGWNTGYEPYCTTYVGAKPATSQACNTHSCVSCRYNLNACNFVDCWGVQKGDCYGAPSTCYTFMAGSAATCEHELVIDWIWWHCGPTCGPYSIGAPVDSSMCRYQICGPF